MTRAVRESYLGMKEYTLTYLTPVTRTIQARDIGEAGRAARVLVEEVRQDTKDDAVLLHVRPMKTSDD